MNLWWKLREPDINLQLSADMAGGKPESVMKKSMETTTDDNVLIGLCSNMEDVTNETEIGISGCFVATVAPQRAVPEKTVVPLSNVKTYKHLCPGNGVFLRYQVRPKAIKRRAQTLR